MLNALAHNWFVHKGLQSVLFVATHVYVYDHKGGPYAHYSLDLNSSKEHLLKCFLAKPICERRCNWFNQNHVVPKSESVVSFKIQHNLVGVSITFHENSTHVLITVHFHIR